MLQDAAENNHENQASTNLDSMLQSATFTLAVTYAFASSLSLLPSASAAKEASTGTLESIPEIIDHPCGLSRTDTSDLDVEEDEEDEVDFKRAPLYAVEERNYSNTSWTRSISIVREPRVCSLKSLKKLSSMSAYASDYDEVPDMTACNSPMSFSSVSTASPTRFQL